MIIACVADAQTKMHPALVQLETSPCQNKKFACEMGCVCSSLNIGRLPVEHCKNPNCMLETAPCTRSNDPSHTPHTVSSLISTKGLCKVDDMDQLDLEMVPIAKPTSVRSRSTVPASRSKKSSTGKKQRVTRQTSQKATNDQNRLHSRIDANDPKLKQKCYVRLTRLVQNETRKNVNLQHDVKLQSKCFVLLERLNVKPDQSTYCMSHRLRHCTCFLPKALKWIIFFLEVGLLNLSMWQYWDYPEIFFLFFSCENFSSQDVRCYV